MFSTDFVRDFTILFQVVTIVVASYYYNTYKKSILRYFILLLWYSFLTDIIAIQYTKHIGNSNSIIYNIYQIVEFTFYFVMYKQTVQKLFNKKIISYLMVFYYGSVLVNCFFSNFLEEFFVPSLMIGAGGVVVSIILYFSEILNSDQILNINKMLKFWISVAMLIFYVPSIPFWVVRKYYVDSPTLPYIFNINFVLVFIVNVLFILGFIWSGKDQKE